MSDTLTQLIAKVQAQLLDDGTLFTTATVTAAARQALADINRAAPLQAAVTIAPIAGQLIYELTDYDPDGLQVTAILLEGTNDVDTELAYDFFVEDARRWFRLREAQDTSDTIIAQYTKPHTINGLDSATDSTLPNDLNDAAITGTVYYCCLIRASRDAEANNVEPRATEHWLTLADKWRARFNDALAPARKEPTQRAEPSTAAWNDSQHDPSYP